MAELATSGYRRSFFAGRNVSAEMDTTPRGVASDGRTRDPRSLLTPSEVAALFRVNPKTVTRWARVGQDHRDPDPGRTPALPAVGGARLPRADRAHRSLSGAGPEATTRSRSRPSPSTTGTRSSSSTAATSRAGGWTRGSASSRTPASPASASSSMRCSRRPGTRYVASWTGQRAVPRPCRRPRTIVEELGFDVPRDVRDALIEAFVEAGRRRRPAPRRPCARLPAAAQGRRRARRHRLRRRVDAVADSA